MSARPRRRRHAAPAVSHDRWLVSYADFMTLLFAFFTTMYAVSTVDALKLSSMVASMQEAFDSRGTPPAVAHRVPAPTPVSAAARQSREADLAALLRTRLPRDVVDVGIDRRGIVVSMREAGSFPTGSADLSASAREVLATLAAAVGGDSAVKLRVEGHTDNIPIQTGRFASNWELSTARATTVVTHLVEVLSVAPDRLSAAGYGEFHPRVANSSEGGRAKNRRVDIVILNDGAAQAEEPMAAPVAGAGR